MRTRPTTVLLLAAAPLLAACNQDELRLVLRYPDQASFDRAQRIELSVGEGYSCEELRSHRLAPRLTFDAHGDAPQLGEVGRGRTSFLARALDEVCLAFLDGCVEADLAATTERTIRVHLMPIAATGCSQGLVCLAGRCVAADAGAADSAVRDTALPDGGATDTSPGDGGAVDGGAADAPVADASTPDALTSDNLAPDTSRPDTSRPDTSTPDTLVPDASTPDAPTPDTSRPDTAAPDTAAPDAGACAQTAVDPVIPQSGLIGAWLLDETSGSAAADSSGNGQDGVLYGDAAWAPGHIGGAVDLHGQDGTDAVELPNSPALDSVQEGSFTVSAWFWPRTEPPNNDTSDASYGILLKNGHHTGLHYRFAQRYVMEHWAGDESVSTGTSRAYPPGHWYHVTGIVDREQGLTQIFVDGIALDFDSWVPGTPSEDYGTRKWYIGTASPSITAYSYDADGMVDQVRIYERVLGEDEILALARELPAAARIVHLSDLSWTSASSGHGPVELDTSNGEYAAGDGDTITINGVTYCRGLGAHAPSSIAYDLAGLGCSALWVDVGVDDECAAWSSVVFRIEVDGVERYDSGLMTFDDDARGATVDVSGASELRLLIDDGNGEIDCDHGDWAAPRLICHP